MPFPRSLWASPWPLLAALAACGSNEPPAPRVADHVSLVSGDGQTAPAGTLLPAPLVFEVGDKQGPLQGVTVTFAVPEGSGFASVVADTSDSQGRVSVQWTVGGTLGPETLSASINGTTAATARATVTVGPLALLTPVSEPNQFVVVGRTVASPPAVRATDGFGNPIAGQAIEFRDSTGRSQVAGATGTTDAQGRVGVTSWRIGFEPGSYPLVASTGSGIAATFVAFGIPAAFTGVGGDNQAVNAGTQVPIQPTVRAADELDRPLAGVAVTFTISGGGGRLLGTAQVRTGLTGVAAAPGWIVGGAPGANELSAETAGLPVVKFRATGVAAVPAAVVATTATTQAGFSGNYGSSRPAVRVTDAAGRPVAGAVVAFAVAQGSGKVSGASPATDFDGNATLGSWRFGSGGQALTATVAGLAPLTFTATTAPAPASTFKVEVRFIGDATASQRAAFDSAAARWSRTIVADLEDVAFSEDLSFCGGQNLNETIDDVVIFAKIERIDGPLNILGQAGPCYLRDDNLLSIVGFMRFDIDDVATLEASGRFRDVVLHEMGHVLGIGSLWNLKGLISGRSSGDPFFTGTSARMAFAAAAAAPGGFGGNSVPVENTGGSGTRDVHWRESILTNELMTGFLDQGANPLSAVTAASLRDEGYTVDDSGADEYSFAAALRAATAEPAAWRVSPLPGPIRTVDRRGRLARLLDPDAGPVVRR